MVVANASPKPRSGAWYINGAISLSIMLLFRFLPAPAEISFVGWAVIGIFFGCIYGWLTTDFVWISIAGLVTYGLTVGVGPSAAWGMMMSNQLVTLILWLMLSVCLIKGSGLSTWLAQWSVTRKVTQGKPWLLWLFVMIALDIVSAIVSVVPAIIVFWELVKPMCKEVGYDKGSRAASFFMFSCVLYATIGQLLMPYGITVVSNFTMLAAGSGGAYDGSYNYAAFMAFSLVVNAVALLGGYLLFRYGFKIDLSKFSSFDSSSRKLEKFNTTQKISLALFVLMFLMLMLPGLLPKNFPLTVLLNSIGNAGAIMIVLCVAFCLRIDGKPLAKFETAFNDNIIWGPLFLFGTGMTLMTTINSPEAGVTAFLIGKLGPALSGMSPIVYVVIMMVIGLALTNVINNAVVTAILVPTSYALSIAAGVNPFAVTACLVLFVDYAILLPSASPAGAMVYSNGGWISRSEIAKFGIASISMLFFASLIIGWPLANWLF